LLRQRSRAIWAIWVASSAKQGNMGNMGNMGCFVSEAGQYGQARGGFALLSRRAASLLRWKQGHRTPF